MVVNYISWFDIFVLNVGWLFYFVLKFEVVGWLGIGFLVKIIGIVFIKCDWFEV